MNDFLLFLLTLPVVLSFCWPKQSEADETEKLLRQAYEDTKEQIKHIMGA